MTSMSQPLHAPELKWSTQGDLTRAHVAILFVNLCLLRVGLDPTPALKIGTELAGSRFFLAPLMTRMRSILLMSRK
jgi:hypothetical protein